MKKNQRFIAGASCPNCDSLDSLLLNMLDQNIECVDCGFQQSEAERDSQKNTKQQQSQLQTPVQKVLPKNIDISSVIRVKNIKE